MNLHRGLNILWAKPSDGTSTETKLAGHGAGKTTFCRMLRYIVDDATFGSKELREAFNDTDQSGYRKRLGIGRSDGGRRAMAGWQAAGTRWLSIIRKEGSIATM